MILTKGGLKIHEADDMAEMNDWIEQHETAIVALNVQDMGSSYQLYYCEVKDEDD